SEARRIKLPPDYLSLGDQARLQACHVDDRLTTSHALPAQYRLFAYRPSAAAPPGDDFYPGRPEGCLRAFRCCATLLGRRMNENIERQAMTPRIIKPQNV